MNILYISESFVDSSLFKSQVHTLCNFHAEENSVTLLALCDKRNEFRSTKSHNVPIVDFDSNSLSIHLKYSDIEIIRSVTIDEFNIIVTDSSNNKLDCYDDFKFYSNGYGKVELA